MYEVFCRHKREVFVEYVLHPRFRSNTFIDLAAEAILLVIFYVNKEETRKAVSLRVFVSKRAR
jgi:hypothetical protein